MELDKYENANWKMARTNLLEKTGFSRYSANTVPLEEAQGLHHFRWCYFGDISSNIFDTSPVVVIYERTLKIKVEKYTQNSELEESFNK